MVQVDNARLKTVKEGIWGSYREKKPSPTAYSLLRSWYNTHQRELTNVKLSMEIATLQTDGISISGPQIDGGYKVTLKTGEYSADEIAKVLLLPKDKVISVKFYVE